MAGRPNYFEIVKGNSPIEPLSPCLGGPTTLNMVAQPPSIAIMTFSKKKKKKLSLILLCVKFEFRSEIEQRIERLDSNEYTLLVLCVCVYIYI
jgi:hypothetical protein